MTEQLTWEPWRIERCQAAAASSEMRRDYNENRPSRIILADEAKLELPIGWNEAVILCLRKDPGYEPPTVRILPDLWKGEGLAVVDGEGLTVGKCSDCGFTGNYGEWTGEEHDTHFRSAPYQFVPLTLADLRARVYGVCNRCPHLRFQATSKACRCPKYDPSLGVRYNQRCPYHGEFNTEDLPPNLTILPAERQPNG